MRFSICFPSFFFVVGQNQTNSIQKFFPLVVFVVFLISGIANVMTMFVMEMNIWNTFVSSPAISNDKEFKSKCMYTHTQANNREQSLELISIRIAGR